MLTFSQSESVAAHWMASLGVATSFLGFILPYQVGLPSGPNVGLGRLLPPCFPRGTTVLRFELGTAHVSPPTAERSSTPRNRPQQSARTRSFQPGRVKHAVRMHRGIGLAKGHCLLCLPCWLPKCGCHGRHSSGDGHSVRRQA